MKERYFLTLTLILLCLVGIPALNSVMSEPGLSLRSVDSTLTTMGRVPASAKTEIEEPHRNAFKAKSVTLELNCEAPEETQETEGSLIRLVGNCWKDKVSIVNMTNGFTASVMETKSKGFTTDFIDLREGENLLRISGRDRKGQSVEKILSVKRRLPASEANADPE